VSEIILTPVNSYMENRRKVLSVINQVRSVEFRSNNLLEAVESLKKVLEEMDQPGKREKMNVSEMFLKAFETENNNIRVSCYDRWLVMDETTHEFIVYEKKPYKRNTYVICRTQNEEKAISCLLGEREK